VSLSIGNRRQVCVREKEEALKESVP